MCHPYPAPPLCRDSRCQVSADCPFFASPDTGATIRTLRRNWESHQIPCQHYCLALGQDNPDTDTPTSDRFPMPDHKAIVMPTPLETSMTIERNANGLVNFLIDQVEEVHANKELDIEKRTRLILGLLKQTRDFTLANLQFKKLYINSPDVAKNEAIVLSVGAVKEVPAISAG